MTTVELLSLTPPWEWPSDAADVLLEALRGGGTDDSELELAAELAANAVVMNDEIAQALLDLLLDPNRPNSVRATAAIALGPTLEEIDLYDPADPYDAMEESLVSATMLQAIRGALHRAYLDADAPKVVRRRALEASVRSHEPWSAGAVRAAYLSGDEEWKVTALFGMGYVPGFDPEILEALDSPHDSTRLEAVRAAGGRGLKKAWKRIRTILESETGDRALLLAAIEAAGSIKPKEAAALFARLDQSDEEIAAAIDEALAMGGALEDPFGEEED